MSRVNDILNELELAARKLGMSIEDAVAVLLGKHSTHTVTQNTDTGPNVGTQQGNPTPVPGIAAAAAPATPAALDPLEGTEPQSSTAQGAANTSLTEQEIVTQNAAAASFTPPDHDADL